MSGTHQKTAESCARSAEAINPEMIERLALAVAKPASDALLIDEDNRSSGRLPIGAAARSGACFAVQLADDMIGLDADTNPAACWVRNSLIGELARRKIPFVVLNSGTPGHLHLFARVRDSRLKQEIEANARFVGCDVRAGQRIRPPLSPHRRGCLVSLVTPANAAQALLALAEIGEQKRAAISKRRPSGRIFALLRDGDREGRYKSRSEVIQAIALAAVNQGYPEKWIFAVLRNPANRAGEKVQMMGEAEARRYVARAYRKAQAYAKAHPAFRRGEAVAVMRGKIDRATPVILLSAGSGQGGATEYSLLAAHLAIAWRIGSLTHGAGDREIAELAGVSRQAVNKAHERLIKSSPFLKRIRRPPIGATTASRWRLRLPADGVADVTSFTPRGGVRPTGKADHTATPGADLWRRGGLGKSKYRVWSLLATPQTAAELATQLNIKVRSVWDHLWALEEHGLCVRDGNGRWHHQRDVDLEGIAKRLGTAGKGARQRALHEHEREIFQQQLHGRRAQLRLRREEAAIGSTHSKPGETLRSRGDNDYSSAFRGSECAGECGGEYDQELAETTAMVERVFPGARLVKFKQ